MKWKLEIANVRANERLLLKEHLDQMSERGWDLKRIGSFYLLYEREKRRAFAKAVEEAVQFFNLCPVCERLVCNDCFLICQDIDMCLRCAEQLQETGEQVSFVGWTTQEDHCDEKQKERSGRQ